MTCGKFDTQIVDGVAGPLTFDRAAEGDWQTIRGGFSGSWTVSGDVQGTGSWTATHN